VSENTEIAEQVITLLDSALTPYLDEFSFEFDKSLINSIIPSPENIPCILKNEPFIMYYLFKEGIKMEEINTNVKLKCFDSKINKNLEYTVNIK